MRPLVASTAFDSFKSCFYKLDDACASKDDDLLAKCRKAFEVELAKWPWATVKAPKPSAAAPAEPGAPKRDRKDEPAPAPRPKRVATAHAAEKWADAI